MIDFTLYYKAPKMEQFKQQDGSYLIPQECIILGDWEAPASVEVQGYFKCYGQLKVNGSLKVNGALFSEVGLETLGDIEAQGSISAGDSINVGGNITALNDIRTTGNLMAPNGTIKTGEGFGIFACGRIQAKVLDNGASVFAGVATWEPNIDKTEDILVDEVKDEAKIKHGVLALTPDGEKLKKKKGKTK